MSMRGALRVGEIQIRVTDMAAARKHYIERMGLIEMMTDAQGLVYLKCWDEHEHHSVVLREADKPGADHAAIRVYDDATLTRFGKGVEAFGLAVEEIPAGHYPKSGRRLQFTTPSSHVIQLYAEKELTGNTLGYDNPGTTPDEGVVRGFRINRLDHVLFGGDKLDETARLFMEVFDFDLSEQINHHETGETLAAFLTCSTKPHDIAFVASPEPGQFHHASFLLESAYDVMKAADLIGKYRIPVDISLNRHGVTRGMTVYYFDPSGNRNEVFSEGYVHYPDTPTIKWTLDEMGPAGWSHDNVVRPSFFEVLT